jgi:S-ribosylhomocysteine lyase
MSNVVVSSFSIDHTKLEAPCIRLADTYVKDGVTIFKYDLRFITPRRLEDTYYKYLDSDLLHSMEHLLATSFKTIFEDNMIDISPMGCHTGFYFTLFVDDYKDENEIKGLILTAISNASCIEIPEPTQVNCGNYLLHNIDDARSCLTIFSRLLHKDDLCPTFKQFSYLLSLLRFFSESLATYNIDIDTCLRGEIQNIVNDLKERQECYRKGIPYKSRMF